MVIVFEEPLLKLANMNFLERKFSKKVNPRFLRYDAVFIFSMEFVKNTLHKRLIREGVNKLGKFRT